MNRLSRLLRKAGLVTLGAIGLWLLAFEPVDLEEVRGSVYLETSLASLQAATSALGELPEGGQLRVGMGRREIVPPTEWRVPLAGNRQLRFTRAQGKRPESVWARAAVLTQGDRRFILVSADIMVISPLLSERVLARLQRQMPIAAGELMLVAAHTHSGPGGYWEGFLAEKSVGPYDERVLEYLVEELTGVALEAWRSRVPATAALGRIDVEEPIRNRSYRGGPENPELVMVRLSGASGSILIDLFSYSAHPTNLLKGNQRLSGDYPALIARQLESETRFLLFLPGTIGDQKSWFRFIRDGAKRADAISEHLITEGFERVVLQEIEGPVLEVFEFEVRMPPLQPRVARSAWLGSWVARPWLARRLFPDPMEETVVQVMRLGPLSLVGTPTDLSSSLGLPLLSAARAEGVELLLVSMAEEWVGYIMLEQEYLELPYKVASQFHGPQSGPLFERVLGQLVRWLGERTAAERRRAETRAAA